jgi:hypothetical protein
MRVGTPKMLDFLGSFMALRKLIKTRQQTQWSQELVNVAAKGIWVK